MIRAFVGQPWLRRLAMGVVVLFSLFLAILAMGITYVAYHPYEQKGMPHMVSRALDYYFPDLKISAESFRFHWNIPTRSLVIDLTHTHVAKRQSQADQHQLKNLKMQFPAASLARFQFWPRFVWAKGLKLRLAVQETTDAPDFPLILDEALGALSQVHNLNISDAKLDIYSSASKGKNQGKSLEMDLIFQKQARRIEATLTYMPQKTTGFTVGFSTKNQKKFRWNVNIQSMKLADFFDKADFIMPALDDQQNQWMRSLLHPVSGRLEFTHDQKAGLQKIEVALSSERLDWKLEGADQTKLQLLNVRLESTVTPNLLQMRELSFVLDNLKVRVNGESRAQFLGPFKGQFALHVEQMTPKDLVKFWPENVLPEGRSWVREHLSDGVFQNTRLEIDHELAIHEKPKDMGFFTFCLLAQAHKLAKLRGEFDLRDVNVQYMDKMPMVEKVSANGKLDSTQLHLEIIRGQSLSQVIQQGQLTILGLDQEDQNMKIDLQLDGPLEGALEIANHEPLKLLEDYGFKPTNVKGKVRTTLALDFPLMQDLQRKDVKVKVAAKATEATVEKLLPDADAKLEESEFDVTITNFGDSPQLHVSAKGQMLGEEYALQLVEHFRRHDGQVISPFKQQLTFTTAFSTKHFTKLWGMPKGFVTGKVPVTLSRTLFIEPHQTGHDGELLMQMDFKPVKIEFGDILLSKPHDEPLSLHIKSELLGGKNARNLTIQSYDHPSINLQGNIHWNASQLVSRGEVEFRSAENLIQLDLQRSKKNELQAGLTVKKIDLKAAWERFRKSQTKTTQSKDKSLVLVNLKAKQVMYGAAQLLSDLSGALEYNETDVTDINLVGQLIEPQSQAHKNFTVSTKKDPKEGPKFVFVTEDLGLVLRAMGFETKVKSGKLRIEARKVSLPDTVFWRGDYVMESFVLEKAPGILKLIKVISPTIITEVFDREKGVKFDRMEGRFRYDDDSLNLYQGQALSPSLGITFEGNLDFRDKTMDITGTMIPAYGLNAAVGYIPVIGQIFAGGPGEGLVAFNFTMQGDIDDPTIQSNPLSALTPGFLRKLMRGSGKQTKEEYPEKNPTTVSSKPSKDKEEAQDPQELDSIPDETTPEENSEVSEPAPPEEPSAPIDIASSN